MGRDPANRGKNTKICARVSVPPDYEITAKGDTDLELATVRARGTAPELIERLQHPPAKETEIGVQVTLTEGGDWETLSLNRVRFDGGNIVGRVDANPVLLKQVRRGDSIRVPPTEIADWYAIDGDTMYANYRWRVDCHGQRNRVSVPTPDRDDGSRCRPAPLATRIPHATARLMNAARQADVIRVMVSFVTALS